ncbi:hypothetical protein JCM8547_005847 [Rhodosporidiobolus lusitaniae]
MLASTSPHVETVKVNNIRPVCVCVFIALGAFIFGYDTGCISGALIMEDFEERFGTLQADGSYALGASRESLIVSFISIGTIIGAIGQSFTSDWIGRKWSILFWSVIFTIGSVIQTASDHAIYQLCVGRLVAGLGVGSMSALVSLFSGEVAPTRLRGLMLTMYTVMNSFGIFLSYVISLASHNLVDSSASWRIPVGVQIPLGLILCIGIFFIPESPRRLIYLGKDDEARKALGFINGYPAESGAVTELVEEIKVGMAKENEGGGSTWKDCFGKEVRSRMIHGIILQMLQQFSGQNYYYYYGASFFEQSGTGLNGWEVQSVMGSVALLFSFAALLVIDGLGRRKALMFGAAGQGACAIVVAVVGRIMLAPDGTPEDQFTQKNRTGGAVVVAFALIHLACYNALSGSIPWVFLGESFPTRLRAKGVTIGTTSNWIWNFLIAFFSPRIASSIGPLIMLIFAVMMGVQIVYVYTLLRETKGLSLESVDEMYRAKVLPWKSSKWQPTVGGPREKSKGLFKRKATEEDDDSPNRTAVPTPSQSKENVTEVYGTYSVKDDKVATRRSLESVVAV